MTAFRFDRVFVKNTGLSALSAACMQGMLALVVYPTLSRTLGTAAFGYFMLAASFTNFVIPVFGGAFANSLLRQHRDVSEERRGGFWLTGNALVGCFGMLMGAALLALAGPLAARWKIPQLAVWLPALVPSMILTMVYYNLRIQLIARVAYKRLVIFDLFYSAGLLLVPIGCASGWLGERWPLLFAAAPACSLAAILPYLARTGGLSLRGAGLATGGRILGPMSIYLFGLVSIYLMRMADRWILGEAGLPGEQIAYYTVAIQAAFLVLFPLDHVSSVLVAYFSNVERISDIEPVHARRYFYALGLSMAGLVLAGPPLGYAYIRFLFGVEYLRVGMTVYLITLGALAIYLLQMFGRGIIVRFRRPVTDPIIQTVFGAISLGLVWVLVHSHGVIGAAIGRNVGFVAVGVAYFFICERELFGHAFFNKGETDGNAHLRDEGPPVDQRAEVGLVRPK